MALLVGGPRKGLRQALFSDSGPRRRLPRLLVGLASLATVAVAWMLGARFTGFIPNVPTVLAELPAFLAEPETLDNVRITWTRVVGSLLIAAALAFVLASGIVRLVRLGPVIERFVTFLLGVPSTIAALLTLFVFRRAEAGVYVVVILITLPFIALIFVGGLRAIDRRLTEMAHVYDIGGLERTRHITLPQLVPHFFLALRNEHGHAWKVAVLAEVFAVGDGMGASFSRAFDRFIFAEVMLWLLAFIIVLLATEYLLLRPLEQVSLRWRRSN